VSNPEGWEKYNLSHWRANWPDFVDFFWDQAVSDPHSTKAFDDLVGWALETTGEIIAMGSSVEPSYDIEDLEQKVRTIDIPTLIIHGTEDRIVNFESSVALQKMIPGAELVTLEGSGHIPTSRYPVRDQPPDQGICRQGLWAPAPPIDMVAGRQPSSASSLHLLTYRAWPRSP
jgi:pimeloyl-ACP methyl ester carboxylesterase